jgi:predicted Fe-S protein YdhL (DUF1289 family)
MYCEACGRTYATKFSYQRHLLTKHSNVLRNVEEDSTSNDSGSEASDNVQNQDSQDISDRESETPEDFWTLLIKDTVETIVKDRIANGKPGHFEELDNVYQLLEGKNLSGFISHMKERYHHIKRIHDTIENDSVLHLIGQKTTALEEKFGDDEFKDEAEDMAWKKYKYLVKKKIVDNLKELSPLVGGGESEDEEEEEESLKEEEED